VNDPIRALETRPRLAILFLALSCLLVVTLVTPAVAQDERTLKQFLEGKMVTVKIDMPATQQGIDLHPEYSPSIDFDHYSSRIRSSPRSSSKVTTSSFSWVAAASARLGTAWRPPP